jgi:hypothetical protein
MREAKVNYKDALNELKKEYKDEKYYADTRDGGLLDRFVEHSDSRYSLYENEFDNFNTSPDGKTYSIYIEQDKMKEEARYEHMVYIEFSTLFQARCVFESLKTSSMTCIMSPATATKKEKV